MPAKHAKIAKTKEVLGNESFDSISKKASCVSLEIAIVRDVFRALSRASSRGHFSFQFELQVDQYVE